jgi:hypothetical protein
MAFEHILNTVDQGVATITLNRPDVLNSLYRIRAARSSCRGSSAWRARRRS